MGIAKRNGVTFRLSTSVTSVLLDADGKQAVGVTLDTGEELKADIVVVNADLVWAMNNLFPPTGYAKRLAEKPVSCSSISFYWSMDRCVTRGVRPILSPIVFPPQGCAFARLAHHLLS